MSYAGDSNPLLAHFDFPIVDADDAQDEQQEITPAAGPSVDSSSEPSLSLSLEPDNVVRQVRGIGWVLKWAGAAGVLFVAASTLAQFAYCVAAEQTLARAARAGVVEATLPRATCASVRQSVERRLSAFPSLAGSLQLILQQNGTPIQRSLRLRDGDRFSIRLVAPTRAALPRWLAAASIWPSDATIEVWAERRMPGRELPAESRSGG